MEKFGVIEAAFDIFKRREKRFVLTAAALGYALVLLAALPLIWVFAGSAFTDYLGWVQELTNAGPSPGSNPLESMPPSVGRLGLVYLVYLPFSIAVAASFEAAVHRWLTRGEAGGGLLGLRIDSSLWNVLLCYLTWIPIALGVFILAGVLVGGTIFAGRVSGGGLIGFLIGLVGVLVGIGVSIYFPARFAPAAALSVARGRYAFFEAWAATRGRALNLIGAYLLLLVTLIVLSLIWSIAMDGVLKRIMSGIAEAGSFGAFFSIVPMGDIALALASYLGVLVFQMVITMAVFGVNARLARVATAGPVAPASAIANEESAPIAQA